MTMESHVQGVARSCFYQVRQLRSIQRSLTANARRLLAVAFIASRVYTAFLTESCNNFRL